MIRPGAVLVCLTLLTVGSVALAFAPANAPSDGAAKELADQPFEIRFGYKLLTTKCVKCHTSERIAKKTDLTLFDWQDVVGTMGRKEKADLGKSDQDFILMYLAYRNEMAGPKKQRTQYQAFVRGCQGCHGIGLMYQKQFAAKDWPGIIKRMAGKGGAEISDEEQPQVLAYIQRMSLDLFGID